MAGLYIHIPYCTRKCIYCDFYSIGSRRADWQALVTALLAELDARCPEYEVPFSTIYVGGGTPSLLPPDCFIRLADGVLARSGAEPIEFTVEVNPDDVTDDMVKMWRRCGVTRFSMGVQSFDDKELNTICRRHTAAQAEAAAKLLLASGADVSIDLIFGLPGQSLESLQRSVEKALALRPHHISLYSLMYEEGTALTLLCDSNRIAEAPEQLAEQMFRYIATALRSAGYTHYEISNFALPGHESRHNSSYWDGTPYLGIGPSAHSYDGLRLRRANPADAERWMFNFLSTSPADIYEEELLDDEQLLDEMILTRLRTAQGLNLDEVSARFGEEAADKILRNAKRELSLGMLEQRGRVLGLTSRGILLSDDIFATIAR